MDKREKRAVNDMGTAMKRIVEVLRRHGNEGPAFTTHITNHHRADALEFAVGKALLAVARIKRKEEKVAQEIMNNQEADERSQWETM